MAQIDIGKVAFAGFGLVRRKPMAVVGWALFLFVVGVLPALAFVGPMMTNISEFIAMAKSDVEPSRERMMEMMSTMYAAHPILWLTGLITRVVLTGAIFRAILEPSAGRWAYMRLGKAEVMMALVVIVLGILIGIGFGVGVAVVVGICAALWQTAHSAAVGAGIILGVGLFLALIWVLLRFSLAAPLSFDEKNFRLFESFRLTKGNSLRLLLVALLVWIMLMVLEVLVAAIAMAILIPVVHLGAGSVALTEESIVAFFSQPVSTWLPLVLPWAAGIGLIGSLVGVVFVAVATAPWAEAYRQLRKTPDALV